MRKILKIIVAILVFTFLSACETIDHNVEPDIEKMEQDLGIQIPDNYEIIHSYRSEGLTELILEFTLVFSDEAFEGLIQSVEQSEAFVSLETYEELTGSGECPYGGGGCPAITAWFTQELLNITDEADYSPDRNSDDYDRFILYKYGQCDRDRQLCISGEVDTRSSSLEYKYSIY